jgi:hypothetical protein
MTSSMSGLYALGWALVAVFGGLCVIMGRRVFVDADWETGEWWALSAWYGGRGMIFAFLFPVARTEHTRRGERWNAAIVVLWGLLLFAGGLFMTVYERTHG